MELDAIGVRIGTLVLDISGVEVVILMHSNIPLPRSVHSSLIEQGFGEQGVWSISQKGPVYSLPHLQLKSPAGSFTQVPLFKQGSETQSSISTEQFRPVKPGKQTQVYVELPSIHSLVPCMSQGSRVKAPENPEELSSKEQ